MMITTPTATTTTTTTTKTTIPVTVNITPNLLITPEQNITMEQNQLEQNKEQFIFIDENDKNELQLTNEPTISDWTDVVQLTKQPIIDTNRYNKPDEETSMKSRKMTTIPETPAFDFTKIETLFSNSTTTSSISDKPERDEIDVKDDNSTEVEVPREENDIYSLNDTTVCSRKSSPSYDEKSPECLNRNSSDQNIDQEKKSKIKENDFPSRESSTNQSFQRSLTPSLDPKLLKQFEEEDRPKRVLRSSTLPKITIISDKSATKLISPNFTIKMAAKKSTNKKSIVKNSKRKKSEKFANNNFTIANTFPVEDVFYSTRLNDGIKRKRLQSKDGNKETENLRNKRLRAEIGGLFGDKLMMTLENLRNTPIRSRHWSGASSSRASTSSSSNEFTVITKMGKKRGSSRELSRNRRNSFNSNWKLTGSPYECFVYVDYFYHEKQSTKQICYPHAVHSKTGDLLRLRDSVRVNSIDGEPNFACICRLFNDPKTGLPLASVLWYYTPMQVKADSSLVPPVFERELLASKHMDIIPLDTVDEIVWVLTYNEYGRFMAETRNDTYPLAQRVTEEDLLWKKGEDNYPRRTYLPRDDTPLEVVYFCRRLYDCKQQKVETKKLTEKNNHMKRSRRHPWRHRTRKYHR